MESVTLEILRNNQTVSVAARLQGARPGFNYLTYSMVQDII
jgi:hypothetical protein